MSDSYKPADFNIALVKIKDGEYAERHVVCAANLSENGDLLVGVRHWDVNMHYQADALGLDRKSKIKFEQGFIDQWNNFMTRDEALQVVKMTGQKLKRPWDTFDTLYSENLY